MNDNKFIDSFYFLRNFSCINSITPKTIVQIVSIENLVTPKTMVSLIDFSLKYSKDMYFIISKI